VEIVSVENDTDAVLSGVLRGAEALVARRFSAKLAEIAGDLRFIQVPFTGVEGIDFSALPADVMVSNAYGHEIALAEHTFALLLAVMKRVVEADRALREGDWRISWAGGGTPLPELSGLTMGIVGLGPIAQAIIPRAKTFGMSVVAVTRRPSPERAESLGLAWLGGLEAVAEMAAKVQVLVVAIALSDVTRKLVNHRVLEAMRNGAYLINVARGDIVDEEALYLALVSGKLAGAGIDTWWLYPRSGERRLPSRLPFHELPNVVMTPHIGGWTVGTIERRKAFVAENLARYFNGERPLHLVDRD
jgi:phosphoglycerate dehydrogenase-like enzyme